MIVVSDGITSIDWTDLKAHFLALEGRNFQWEAQRACLGGLERTGWGGQTPAQTAQYLREGFRSPLFTTQTVAAVPRRRKRARWDECDGDADAGRLIGGCDDFYLTRGHVDARPGLSLEVVTAFASNVGAPVIAEYGAWCASLIGALEADGYDLEVAITIPCIGNTFADAPSEHHATRVIVKRPGEVSDFAAWSVLFSPGGFRHLGFIAIGMACEARRRTVHGAVGRPASRDWDVVRDPEDPSRITVHCNPLGRSAMGDKLDTAARAAGIL